MHGQDLADDLSRLIAAEAHSLASHLREATPHLDARTYPLWQRLQFLLHASAAHARRLNELLAALHRPALPPAPFPTEAGYYHDLDLGTLLPHLIAEKERQLALYAQALTHTQGEPAIEAALRELEAENRRLLAELQAAAAEL